MFKLVYRKFIQDTAYQILSESTDFVEDMTNAFWCVFSVHSAYEHFKITCTYNVQLLLQLVTFGTVCSLIFDVYVLSFSMCGFMSVFG